MALGAVAWGGLTTDEAAALAGEDSATLAGMLAGLHEARGRAVVLMDADGQDPPELIPAMLEHWRQGYDVVYGIRKNRKEPRWKRAGYHLFYRGLYRLVDLRIPPDAGDFCLM